MTYKHRKWTTRFIQRDSHRDVKMHRVNDKKAKLKRERERERERERQTDRDRDRQTDRQIDRQIESWLRKRGTDRIPVVTEWQRAIGSCHTDTERKKDREMVRKKE